MNRAKGKPVIAKIVNEQPNRPEQANMPRYRKAEEFVVEAFEKAGNPHDVFHARRTAYWISQLKPDADEALLIAGVAHDIERAFHGDWKAGSSDPEALRKHQELSAREIENFLRKENVDPETIARVIHLVSHHEEGGDADQNILCDADCLAFFEEKAVRNARKAKENGKEEEMRKRINSVYGRISSPEAKKKALGWYEDALEILGTS